MTLVQTGRVPDGEQFVPPTAGPRSSALRISGVVAIALMLRAPIAGIGPIIDDIQSGLGLAPAAVSLLTALPVLCFGFGSLAGPALARRFGVDVSLQLVVGLLAAGLIVRVLAGPVLLYAGTILSGGAIAVTNVLLPRLVKQDFADRAGLVTGLYTAAIGVSSAVAALIAVPLETWTGHGWRGSLQVWGFATVLAFAVWSSQLRHRDRRPSVVTDTIPARTLLRNRRALALSGFMGLQSLSFYVCLAWVPSLLRDAGYSHGAAGAYLSLLTSLGIPMAIIVPALAGRRTDQRVWAVGLTTLVGLGFLGLLIAPASGTYVWVALLGIGTGATFPLALLMMVLRASTPIIAGQLSAMSQSIGYFICAIGPFAVGVLHDAFDSWRPPLTLMLVLVCAQAISGVYAGRTGLAA